MELTKPIIRDALFTYANDSYPESIEDLKTFFDERDLNIDEDHAFQINEFIEIAPMLFITYQIWDFFYGVTKEKYKEELKSWLPSLTGSLGFFYSKKKKKLLREKLVKRLEIGISTIEANQVVDKFLELFENQTNAQKENTVGFIPLINIYGYFYTFIFFICIIFPIFSILFYISNICYFIISEYLVYSIIPSIEEQQEFFDYFSSDLFNALNDNSLWEYFFIENTYALIFSLIMSSLGLYVFVKIIRILKVKFLKKIAFAPTRKNEIDIYKLINEKTAKPINLSILESTGNKPFVSRYKKNRPAMVIPQKYFQNLNTIKTQFIVFHEFYHILNGDYTRNNSIRTILLVLLIIMTLVKTFVILIPIGYYNDIPETSFLSVIALSLFLTALIHIVKQNERRANYYAFKKLNELDIDNLFAKDLSFVQRIFYPGFRSCQKYIKSFPKKEISFLHIFFISVAAYAPIWALPSLFNTIAFGAVNSFLIISSFLITIHLNQINLNFKLSIMTLIYSYCKWVVSIFVIMLIIVGIQKPEALLDDYIYKDVLGYLFPFVFVLIFIPLIKFFKINNLILFLSLIGTAFLIDFGMTYTHPDFMETSIIYGVSAIICIGFTWTNKKFINPLFDRYI